MFRLFIGDKNKKRKIHILPGNLRPDSLGRMYYMESVANDNDKNTGSKFIQKFKEIKKMLRIRFIP